MARILVIDDDDSVRTVLLRMLAQLGHTVVEARDGREGLAQFRAASFDLVITDIVMPDVEGLEVLMELRKEHSPVRVLAISGGGRQRPEDYLRLATLLGATKVLAKPFGYEQFVTVIKELLSAPPVKAAQ